MTNIGLPLALAITVTSSVAAGGAATVPVPPLEGRPQSAWLARYAEARQGQEQTATVSRSFAVGADGALDLANISGDVRVTGGGSSEIRVEATKRVRHRDADEARRLLDELRVEMTTIGRRVEVRTIYPRRREGSGERSVSASVDYVVTVPKGASVAVKTISGDVRVAEVAGEIRAEAVSGDVTIATAPNVAVARTVSGDVTVRDAGGASLLTLGTVSGSVIATGVRARTLECGTVSGDLRLSALQVERLQAKSVSGDIEFGATVARGGRYDVTSHSGDIRVTVPGDGPGFELDASTFSGSVRSDLPITLRTDPSAGSARGRGASSRTIRGTYGDASALLSVRTFSGSVVIARQ
jgi:DUF4097 and DUF4098 domain-containing protein YvlB